MFELLAAEATTHSTPDGLIGGLVGASGGISFAIWYGWYVTTKTIPKIVDDFREERKLDREDRKSDRDERKLERDEFKSTLKTIVTTIEMVPCQAVYEELRRREMAQHPQEAKWPPSQMSL